MFVKVPVTNTKGESSVPLVRELSRAGVQLNVTALLSLKQVEVVGEALEENDRAIVSVFAGRIADTGRDPVPIMGSAVEILAPFPNVELLWASPREILNVCQAAEVGCDIITATPEILRKLEGLGRSLEDVSLDTVKMFHDDATSAAFVL